jgi:hypothetical protein
MVNFNNETTVGQTAGNLIRLLLIEARYNCFAAFEKYNDDISKGINSSQTIVKARLGTWLLELQPYLDRTAEKLEVDKSKLKDIKDKLFFSKKVLNYKDLLEILEYLNNTSDKLRITRLDTRQVWDTLDIELDNKNEGYA